MNFAGPFDAELSHVSPVSLGGDGFTFNKPTFIQHHSSDSHVVIPDAHLLFSGDYTRIGSDLIISGDGQKLVVGNYFKGETRPALTTKDGATLAGHIVDALTGHVHYAQANTAAPAAGQVIGNVLKLSGSATAIRNGVSIELHIGDAVQKGDVIQTGSDSSIGMTFVDGSAFGMTSNARMVLNEMIYDPNGSSNSSLMSLVQGTITFVAGQTAKNGNMRVETPVATMGIRGTAVLVEIGANDGPTKFSVLVEPDGHTGSYNLYDKATGQLIGTVSQAGQVTYVTSLGLGQPPSAIEQLKTLQDQQNEKAIIQQVFQLYFPNYNPDDSNPKSPKFGYNTSGNNLAEIIFTTNSNKLQTFLTQIELRFAVTDPVTGAVTYQNKIFYNARASFSALSVSSDQAFTPTTETFKFADVVKIDDPDIGTAPFYDIGVPFVPGSAIIKSAVSTIPQMSEAFLKSLLSIDQTTGVVSFDRQQFNFLDDSQTVTFKIQVTATSGPDIGVVEIPVTITGENDAPTIVVGDPYHPTVIAGTVTEDTPLGASSLAANGTITFLDFDLTDKHTATVALTSTSSDLPGFVSGSGNNPATTRIGTFTIDPVSENLTDTDNKGSVGWHFTLDDDDPTLQSLAADQTITQTYTITIKDNNGVPVTQIVTITITGTNDAPVLAADSSIHNTIEISDTTGAPNTTVDTATGTLTFVDVDLIDTHQASAVLHSGAGSVVWSGGNYNDIPQATRDALNDAMTASVSENNTDTNNQGSVSWVFELPDHLFDFLAKGQTLTLVYDVTVTDINGSSSTQQITIKVGAANDQPVISVIDAGAAVQEDASVQPGNLLKDTGSVTFTDTDLSDTHTVHVAFNGASGGNGGSVSTGLLAALGTALSVPGSSLAAGVHTFNWDFALNNDLVQYLGAGETVIATYTITVKDLSGDTTNDTSVGQTVTVVITGTNDTPVITAVNVSGAVKEDTALELGNVLHDTGSVTFADADLTDHATASVAFVTDSTTSAPIPGGLYTALEHALTLQTDSFASNSGTINWSFDLDNSLVQYLADGETITVTYTITVTDDSGTATDTSAAQTVTVVITGTNDAPVVSGAVIDISAVEDGGVSVLDALANASDVDNGHVLSVVNVPGPLPAGVTYNAADHTFTLDPGNAAYQHLAAGQTTVVTVNYGVSDGIAPTPTAASVSWTITGTNDAPTVSGAVTTTVAEDASTSTLNALANASDVDDGTVLSVVNVGTLPAGVTYDSVNHTFTLDPANAAYQSLAVGQSTVVTVNYAVTDSTVTTPVPASVSWTVTGTNDDPVLSASGQLSPEHVLTPAQGLQDNSMLLSFGFDRVLVAVNDGSGAPDSIGETDPSGLGQRIVQFDSNGQIAGTDRIINQFVSGDQRIVATASSDDGIKLVVWVSGNDGGARLIGSDGEPIGNEAPLTGLSSYVYATALSDGGFAIAGSSDNFVNISVTKIGADGQIVGTPYVVDSGTYNEFVVKGIAPLDDGGYLLFRENNGLIAQEFGADATPVGSSFAVSSLTSDISVFNDLNVVRLGDHKIFVSWSQQNPASGSNDIFARVLNPDGSFHGSDFLVSTDTQGQQTTPFATALSNGHIAVSWYDDHSIWVRYVDEDGNFLTDPVQVNSTPLALTALYSGQGAVATPDGGIMFAWRGVDSDGEGVRGQHVSASGQLDGPEVLFNDNTVGQQMFSAIAATESGTIFVSWFDQSTGNVVVRSIDYSTGLTLNTTEGNAPVVRDLLLGASDGDNGDTLSVVTSSISYSINGGPSTTTTPDGITFPDEHTINVDAAGIHHVPAGATETIVVSYDITDNHGGIVSQTETITITGTNDRPVLAAGLNLTTITEDQISNPGQSVSSFATGISDPDNGALKGVAITGSTSQNGHWEYSLDDGSSWTAFGTYSSTGGLLLASDDKVRFVPNGENGGTDTLTYVAWDQTSGSHGQVTNTVYPQFWAAFSEGSQAQTTTLTVTSLNDAPHIDVSNAQLSSSGGSITISGAAVVDPDTADGFTVSLQPDSGTATGTLDSITYTPPGIAPQIGQVAATVTDTAGAHDTVNFVFNVSGTGPLAMQSTSEKDVFFATAYQDTFVFTSGSNQDTISGFTTGTDKIDLQAFSSIDTVALTTLLANADHIGSDTLLHLNGNTDTLLLKGVTGLTASDFILHA